MMNECKKYRPNACKGRLTKEGVSERLSDPLSDQLPTMEPRFRWPTFQLRGYHKALWSCLLLEIGAGMPVAAPIASALHNR